MDQKKQDVLNWQLGMACDEFGMAFYDGDQERTRESLAKMRELLSRGADPRAKHPHMRKTALEVVESFEEGNEAVKLLQKPGVPASPGDSGEEPHEPSFRGVGEGGQVDDWLDHCRLQAGSRITDPQPFLHLAYVAERFGMGGECRVLREHANRAGYGAVSLRVSVELETMVAAFDSASIAAIRASTTELCASLKCG